MSASDFWENISFSEKNVIFSLKGNNKSDVLAELIDNVLVCNKLDLSRQDVLDSFLAREKKGSTGLPNGIAVPHIRCRDMIDKVFMAVGIHREGVDFKSLDKKPAHLIILTIVPEEMTDFHLIFLSRVSSFLFKLNLEKDLLRLPKKSSLYEMMRKKI